MKYIHYYTHFIDGKTKAILQGLLFQVLYTYKVCKCVSGDCEPPQMARPKVVWMCIFGRKDSWLYLNLRRCMT